MMSVRWPIAIFIITLIMLAVLAYLGYDHWQTLQ